MNIDFDFNREWPAHELRRLIDALNSHIRRQREIRGDAEEAAAWSRTKRLIEDKLAEIKGLRAKLPRED